MKKFSLALPFTLLGFLGVAGIFAYHEYENKTIQTVENKQEMNAIIYTQSSTSKDEIIQNNFENILENSSFLQDIIIPTSEPHYNTSLDASIHRYVSRFTGLNDQYYIPENLEAIPDDIFTMNRKGMLLRKNALQELKKLGKEFTDIFDKKLVIVSAYRSHDYQQAIIDRGCAETLCAPAGHSEHQLGLSVDLFAATTANQFLSKQERKTYYERLLQNAHRYGRHNTYQRGAEIDTYQPEPRHWRYVGRDLATELFEKQQTFAEWMEE